MWGDHPPLVTFSTREEILFYQRIKHAGEVTSSVSSQGLHCTSTSIMKVFATLLACAAMVSARNLKLDELDVGFCGE